VNSTNPPLRCAARHTPHSRLAAIHPPEWAEQVLQNETDSRSITACTVNFLFRVSVKLMRQ